MVLNLKTFLQYKKKIFEFIKKIEPIYKTLGINILKIFGLIIGQDNYDFELANASLVYLVEFKEKNNVIMTNISNLKKYEIER